MRVPVKPNHFRTLRPNSLLSEAGNFWPRTGNFRGRSGKFSATIIVITAPANDPQTRSHKGDTSAIDEVLAFGDIIGLFKEPSENGQKPGVVIVPEKVSDEEWEKLYGADACGDKYFLSNGQPRPAKVTRPFSVEAGNQLLKLGNRLKKKDHSSQSF